MVTRSYNPEGGEVLLSVNCTAKKLAVVVYRVEPILIRKSKSGRKVEEYDKPVDKTRSCLRGAEDRMP